LAFLLAGNLQASDGEMLSRYFTLAYDGDHVTLAPNETALIVGTAFNSLTSPAWTIIQYKRGKNDSVPITLELGVSGNNLPLSGPAVIVMTSTNWDYTTTGPGIVGLKIVRSMHRNGDR
jgi:hypothetical protein